jgi:hypothetical protein
MDYLKLEILMNDSKFTCLNVFDGFFLSHARILRCTVVRTQLE